jgi:hypothetical protein
MGEKYVCLVYTDQEVRDITGQHASRRHSIHRKEEIASLCLKSSAILLLPASHARKCVSASVCERCAWRRRTRQETTPSGIIIVQDHAPNAQARPWVTLQYGYDRDTPYAYSLLLLSVFIRAGHFQSAPDASLLICTPDASLLICTH